MADHILWQKYFQILPGFKCFGFEIDPEITMVAEKFFDLKNIQLKQATPMADSICKNNRQV